MRVFVSQRIATKWLTYSSRAWFGRDLVHVYEVTAYMYVSKDRLFLLIGLLNFGLSMSPRSASRVQCYHSSG